MKALLVEDDALICLTLVKQLHACGSALTEVTTCTTAQAALDRYHQTWYPLVLLDLGLPDLDGIDLCRQLRAQPQGDRSMIVVITSRDTAAALAAALDAGADDYLLKPVSTELLKVRLMIIERQWRQQNERKQVEAALRDSEVKFKMLFDILPIGVSILDQERRLVDVNPALAKMLALPKERLLAGDYAQRTYLRADRSLMPPAELPSVRAFQEGADVHNVEIGVLTEDGALIWTSVSASPFPLPGLGVAITTADITRRKQVEEELQALNAALEQRVAERTAELSRLNAELLRASRLKDEFLANMSHELRTPLSNMLLMAELLQQEIYGILNANQRKPLHAIEQSGKHLLALINDILDLAKIGNGKLALEIAPVSIKLLCDASLQCIKELAQQKRIAVALQVDPHVTALRADSRRLTQILINLLSNAVKFTPEGGTVGLEIMRPPGQQSLAFTVWDTGIGIAPPDVQRLFQPFVQLDSTLSRKYEGTGLGLALVYRLTRLHGGSIAVTSEVGKGSRFTVTLPWQEAVVGEMGRWGDREMGS